MNRPDKNLKRALPAVSLATRYVPANFGGNWKGKEYLSQREHDLLTRLTRLGPNAELRAMGIEGPLSREQALAIIKQKRAA